MAENYIEVSHLVKTYGNFTAVSDISFDIAKGEFMGLLGPNGAGKSTTLKAVTGLLRPTSGEIRIQGIDIKDHRRALQHVGSVIETPMPYGEFTPADLLYHVGRMYGLDKQETSIRSRDVLEEMKLWDWRYKKIDGFSKGMKQRVVLAQALLPNPEIIVLDEPTSGLDPRGMVEIREILKGLKKRDSSLLISTHILSEVSELCGSVTMIRDGKAVISGDVAELLSGSMGGVTLEIKMLRDITESLITDISGCQGVKEVETMGDHIVKVSFDGTPEQQAELISVAYSSGLGLMSVNESGKNLESLYMELTEGEGAA
ncbi:MAG: ABC transporter ATP-binding protein [Candidatus Methanomethylophilaceae archaeon]|nr:ABC transporter ATP-binding protein [Candidatus Methanomethylophilaceae archaeon]MBP5734460.1 ABC transporter ATP-binding protein [Candidatus Methanomethylophilaceae archaeon]